MQKIIANEPFEDAEEESKITKAEPNEESKSASPDEEVKVEITPAIKK
jgi:hypothetical protein